MRRIWRVLANRKAAWAAGLITLGGLALRLWRLGEQCFWFDEAQTLYIAQLPLAQIALRTYRPPLYHWLLHFWRFLVEDSEFWLRLPSALLGAAVTPLVFLVAARLYDRRTALLAAALAAISPTLLWYAQEMRMYSLMTFEFLILLHLVICLLNSSSPQEGTGHRVWTMPWLWVALWLVEVASLYTHYFAIPFVLWLVGLTALSLALMRRWRTLWAWLGLQSGVLLAFSPWLWVIRGGRGGTEDYLAAEIQPGATVVPGIKEAISQIWRFYTMGTTPLASNDPWVTALLWAAAAVLGLVIVLLLWRLLPVDRATMRGPSGAKAPSLWRRETGRPWAFPPQASDVGLLALILVPWAVAILLFQLRPGVIHPRHMMMIAGPWMILIARAGSLLFVNAYPHSQDPVGNHKQDGQSRTSSLSISVLSHLLGLVSLGVFVTLFGLGLNLAYKDPGRQRPDVRKLAQDVADLTKTGDVVLLPYVDYAFNYYFHGPATAYHLETRVGDTDLANWFLPRAQGAQRAVFIRWVQAFVDPRDFLTWFLQVNGRLHQADWQADRWVAAYDLASPLVMPVLTETNVRWESLALHGVYWPTQVPADQRVPVALQWQTYKSVPADYKATLRVLDPDGHGIAAFDRLLLAEQNLAPTSHWANGLSANNYYLPTLPIGTPPISYTLTVSLYDDKRELDILNASGAPSGTRQILGTVRITPPASWPANFPDQKNMTRVGREVAPGLQLEGFALDAPSLTPGMPLAVTLYWKALIGQLPDYVPALRILSTTGQELGRQQGRPAYDRYPCTLWQSGELVIDRRTLVLPPGTEPGPISLQLAVADNAPLVLQTVNVDKSDRQFVFPPIEHSLEVAFGQVALLKGFSLEEPTVGPDDPPRLTLYWQGINEAPIATAYVAFVHLLDPQNHMVAQHDGPPTGGRWPTTTWVTGQAIVDRHELAFKEGEYQGEAFLEVGLYDPQTLVRLRTTSGDDKVILPIKVAVRR